MIITFISNTRQPVCMCVAYVCVVVFFKFLKVMYLYLCSERFLSIAAVCAPRLRLKKEKGIIILLSWLAAWNERSNFGGEYLSCANESVENKSQVCVALENWASEQLRSRRR